LFRKFKQEFSFFFCFFFFITPLIAGDDVEHLGKAAQAFMYAQDYEKASQIYRDLLTRSLPNWQQALVFYNLGTIKLAQYENREALDFYRLIPFDSIVNPQLFRKISLNKALAYFNQAQALTLHLLPFELEEQMEYYQSSLEQFEATRKSDCLLQKFEGEDILPCQTFDAVSLGIDKVKSAIGENKMKQLQNLLNEKNFYDSIFVLTQSLKQFDDLFHSIIAWNISSDLKNPYWRYFIYEAESLLPLWNQIQTLSLKVKQKEVLDQAMIHFHDFLVELQKENINEAKDELELSLKPIAEMELRSEKNRVSKLLIKYRLILLEEELKISSLIALQKDQEELKKNDNETLIEANDYLAKSLDYFSTQQQQAAYFFLVASFQKIKNLNLPATDSPEIALKQALMQAWEVKKMTRLFLNLSKEITLSESILKKVQEDVIQAGKEFFSVSLSFQKKMFSQRDGLLERCQDQPWDQVLPLFSKGNQTASAALGLIHQPREAMIEQESTIENWKKALEILSPPPSKGSLSNSKRNEQEVDRFKDLFRSIEEMEAQDTTKEKMIDQELHTW